MLFRSVPLTGGTRRTGWASKVAQGLHDRSAASTGRGRLRAKGWGGQSLILDEENDDETGNAAGTIAGMLIRGKCHCGNISFPLTWEPDPAEIATRACTSTRILARAALLEAVRPRQEGVGV